MNNLWSFIAESNTIEGIHREPTSGEIDAHKQFLSEPELSVPVVEAFVWEVAHTHLRHKAGMDVRVGSHVPMRGGPNVTLALNGVLQLINDGTISPLEAHVRYEMLHPYMDGNGRSGRAVWAWQMKRDGLDPFALPFLHRFYYQSLDAAR